MPDLMPAGDYDRLLSAISRLTAENAALCATLERIDKLAHTKGDHATWVAMQQIRAECAKHKETAS